MKHRRFLWWMPAIATAFALIVSPLPAVATDSDTAVEALAATQTASENPAEAPDGATIPSDAPGSDDDVSNLPSTPSDQTSGEEVSPEEPTEDEQKVPELPAADGSEEDAQTPAAPSEDSAQEDESAASDTAFTGWKTESDGSHSYYRNGRKQTGWLIGIPGLTGIPGNRFYVNEDGALVTGFFQLGDHTYYANPLTGEVLTGAIVGHSEAGREIYLADQRGHLATEAGWMDSAAYGNGPSTYYLDEASVKGQVSAKPGTISVDGSRYHVGAMSGAVARTPVREGGKVYYPEADGRLHPAGFYEFDAGEGWQRYYLNDDGSAKTGFFFQNGANYFANDNGAIQRGKIFQNGKVYLGSLADGSFLVPGWNVTADFDGTTHRYWVEADGSCRTGYFSVDGYDYYGRPSDGYVEQESYFKGDDGVLRYANIHGQITRIPVANEDLFYKAQNYSSATNWLILVNTSRNRVGVYQRSNGIWVPVHEWLCTSGAPGTPTVTGEFTVQSRGYVFGHGYSCYYWTQFYGDYLFHSVLYNQGTFTVQDGRLGINASHGCVRLALENAKWINQNIPSGTKVVVYR